MNLFGKICAFFLVPVSAACALYLAGRLFDVRSKYQAKYDTLVQTRDKNQAQLKTLEPEVAALDRQISLVQNSWGQEWTAPNSSVQGGAEPIIDLGVGMSAGLATQPMGANKPLPTVFVFATTPDGQSRYLGDFDVVDPRADRTGVKLTHPPLAGESETWQAGLFRVRDLIPIAHRSNFYELRSQQIQMDQKLQTEQDLVRLKDIEIAGSKKQLDSRMAELNGNPNALPEASEDVKEGLVKSLAKEEGVRDVEQAQVEKLRRELSDKFAELQTLLAKNAQIVEQMEKERGVAGDRQTVDAKPLTTSLPLPVSR
ncbi:hypothetical protein [Planctomyces sp. SH-PL14]|uniref:hypothetical protein n=1 Tax=Planctomyces sp. SH-PL14 TaxID=1632864 RepID=UPI00078E73ED|nr:hypothetical protein [Planctomyces sp. SH-PL14]AMV19690.1 hypothetical protein VT03_17470 [Planctomyces sp. SH-PL14]